MRILFIFTSFFILHVSYCETTLSQKLKEKLFKPKDCLPKIIETYTASDAPQRSVQSDESMLSLCPNLHESCCLKNNMSDLHSLVIDQIESIHYFQEQYTYLVNTINSASSSKTSDLIKNLENKFREKMDNGINSFDSEDFEEPREVTALKEAIEYIKSNSSVILEDLDQAVQFVISVNSRFGCAICDPENLWSFKNMKSKTPSLILDMAQCRDIFQDPSAVSLFRLDMHTTYIYAFVRSMVLVEKGSSPNDQFMTADEVSNIPALIENCMNDTNFLQKPDCKNLCLGLHFFNGNPFFDIEKSIIAGSLLIDSFLKGSKKLTEEELNSEYETLEEKIAKRLFVMPHLKDTIHVEFLDQIHSWNHGWNIMKFEMNYEVQTKPMVKKKMEEFILRAVRSPEELFQRTSRAIPIVETSSKSIKALSFVFTALILVLFSN
jgi:hypothetical protein